MLTRHNIALKQAGHHLIGSFDDNSMYVSYQFWFRRLRLSNLTWCEIHNLYLRFGKGVRFMMYFYIKISRLPINAITISRMQ